MSNIKICLNMIVKNESKIITRLFDTIISIIDFWVISDTGSTDNTPEIIENYFKEKNIPGLLCKHEWKNFGHNRTLSLLSAQQSEYEFDYVLFLDADMKLVIKPNFDKNRLIHDVYHIKQGGPQLTYYNVRLLKKNLNVKCVSPTHEYYDISGPHTTSYISDDELFIDDIGDGGAKSDKFERDIRLLKQGIEEEPNNPRYYFYLAQSYRCIGDNLNAIDAYEKRITKGGWGEEIWYSYYQIGNIYLDMKCEDKAIYNYLMAYNVNPTRVENIYEIAKLYRFKEKYHLANHFADMGRNIIASKKLVDSDTLFKVPSIYDYLLDYEKSIDAYYSGEKEIGLKISNELILNSNIRNIEYDKYQQVLYNLKFYAKKFSDFENQEKKIFYKENLILDDNYEKNHKNLFNPSIAIIKNNIYINFRCSNYNVEVKNNNLEYKVYRDDKLIAPNLENPVSTINLLAQIDKNLNITNTEQLDLNINLSSYPFFVKGIEDIRIIEFEGGVYFIGNSREVTPDNIPKMILGKYDLEKKNIEKILLLHGYEDNNCQKNWSPFIYRDKLLLIYSFSPFIILEPNLETGKCSIYKNEKQLYNYSNFRGGSQGFYINNDLYFLIHEVVNNNGRLYFHRFVKLKEDLSIEKVSYPFYFENWGIEYVAGAIYDKDSEKILISWGENDKNANLSSIRINNLDKFFY
jgi:hypothetical protein